MDTNNIAHSTGCQDSILATIESLEVFRLTQSIAPPGDDKQNIASHVYIARIKTNKLAKRTSSFYSQWTDKRRMQLIGAMN
jgi:hypothetical protein